MFKQIISILVVAFAFQSSAVANSLSSADIMEIYKTQGYDKKFLLTNLGHTGVETHENLFTFEMKSYSDVYDSKSSALKDFKRFCREMNGELDVMSIELYPSRAAGKSSEYGSITALCSTI